MTRFRINWPILGVILTFAVLLLFENGVSKGLGAVLAGEISAGGSR